MKQSFELNRDIEEQIFGVEVVNAYPHDRVKGIMDGRRMTVSGANNYYRAMRYKTATLPTVRFFSTEIEEAWKIVEHMHTLKSTHKAAWLKFSISFQTAQLWQLSASQTAKTICLLGLEAMEVSDE